LEQSTMMIENPSREPTFGYLTVFNSAEHGYFGGYLILSALGRPLEFHCTAPVRPSRAQEILYGPTLQPYLVGEQISGTLLGVAKLTPRLILTDNSAVMYVRRPVASPIVLVVNVAEGAIKAAVNEANGGGAASTMFGDNLLAPMPAHRGRFAVANYEFQLPHGCEADQQSLTDSLLLLSQHVDVAEPFDRIHEAIREAQRIGGRTSETNGQAA
jgi:hypothetical protein